MWPRNKLISGSPIPKKTLDIDLEKAKKYFPEQKFTQDNLYNELNTLSLSVNREKAKIVYHEKTGEEIILGEIISLPGDTIKVYRGTSSVSAQGKSKKSYIVKIGDGDTSYIMDTVNLVDKLTAAGINNHGYVAGYYYFNIPVLVIDSFEVVDGKNSLVKEDYREIAIQLLKQLSILHVKAELVLGEAFMNNIGYYYAGGEKQYFFIDFSSLRSMNDGEKFLPENSTPSFMLRSEEDSSLSFGRETKFNWQENVAMCIIAIFALDLASKGKAEKEYTAQDLLNKISLSSFDKKALNNNKLLYGKTYTEQTESLSILLNTEPDIFYRPALQYITQQGEKKNYPSNEWYIGLIQLIDNYPSWYDIVTLEN